MGTLIEDLEARLAAAVTPREKVDTLNALALGLRYTDLQRAFALAEEASALSNPGEGEGSYQHGKAESLYILGILNLQCGLYEQSQSILSKALLLYDILGEPKNSATTLSALGTTYSHMGDYPTALDHYFRVLQISRDVYNPAMQADALNNIGFLYTQLNDWKKALSHLEQSLVLSRLTGQLPAQAAALEQCCHCYRRLGRFDEAISNGQQSLALYQQLGNRQGEATALGSLGEVYRAQSCIPEAQRCFEQALEICRQTGLRLEGVHMMRSLSDIYHRQGQVERGIEHLEQALKISQDMNARREVYACHQSLAAAYKQRGDFEQALAHYEQFFQLKQNIFNEDADQRLKALEAGYRVETAQKEAEIYQLRNVALQQEISVREQAETALQVINQQLKREIEQREVLIADLNAFAHMVAHDLKNPLGTLVLSSEMLWKNAEPYTDSLSLEYIRVIRQMAQKMDGIVNEMLLLASVRQEDIQPVALHTAHILTEVENRLSRQIRESQAELIKPTTWPIAMGYAPWIEEVWENYISNAIKYGGRPPRVEVGATPLINGSVRFWVRDNGDGIAKEKQAGLFTAFYRPDRNKTGGQGLGLSIVKRIIEKLGGEVSVESAGLPNLGSVFSFTLPGMGTGALRSLQVPDKT